MTDAGDLLSKAATSPGPRVSAMKYCQAGKSRGTFSWGWGKSGPLSCPGPHLEGSLGGRGLNGDRGEESDQIPVRTVYRSDRGPKPRFSVLEATFRIVVGGRYGGGYILHAPRVGGGEHLKRRVSQVDSPLIFG